MTTLPNTTMTRSLRFLTACTALALAACSENPSEVERPGPGTLSFSYQGPVSGTMDVEGDIRLDRAPLGQTATYGQRFSSPNGIEAHAAAATGDMVDGITVRIPGHATGTFTIDDDQCGWWDDECPGIFVFLGLRNANGAQARYSCTIQTGTVRLTEVSETRAKGTFSGSGECLDSDGGFPPITISNGRFDVKLLQATRG